MDKSNWRPTQGGSANGRDSFVESGDWRSQLKANTRQRILNKMDMQTSGGFQQQRPMSEASSTSLDSTAQTRNANGGDWQEEVYQKIKAMKDLYLQDLNDMHQIILGKLQQHDSLPQQPKNEQLEKLKIFKNMLERFMAFLQIPKHNIMANYKDKLGTYEKQIQNVINSNRRKPAATQQQTQALPPPHLPSVQQSQQTQVQPHESQMNSQMQTVNLQGSMAAMQQNNMGSLQQNSVSSVPGSSNAQQNMMGTVQLNSNLDPGQNASLDSTAQTGNVNGGDWQEEVYQKIKAMKDLYLLDLNDMHQRVLDKLQQWRTFLCSTNLFLSNPKNEELEKLKVFKNMLERFMAFLQIPKHNVMAIYKDKLGTYEMQIQNIVNSNRWKPAATQQQTRVHLQQPYSNSNRRIPN